MKNAKNARILQDICPKNTFSPNFGGNSRLSESERIRPQHQLRDHGGHRSTGAIVLIKLFMHHLMLLYSISLDA